MLNKPEPELYYDYQKCKRYLESKYGFTYADFKEFWDSLEGQICGNGCLIPISRDSFDDEDEDRVLYQLGVHDRAWRRGSLVADSAQAVRRARRRHASIR